MAQDKEKSNASAKTELIVTVILLLFLLFIISALVLLKPAEFDLKVIVLQALRYYLKQLIIASRLVGKASVLVLIGLSMLATAALSGLYFLFGVFQARRRPDEDEKPGMVNS